MIRKAVIPAAGFGTRFLPATKAQPKEMMPIVDKPTIQYVVEEAVASGITDILIVTGRGKRAIEDHFDKSYELEHELQKSGKGELLELVKDISSMVNIFYVRQKEPKGLGHAILCAKQFIGNEPFAVLLGDDIVSSEVPCLKQLINAHNQRGATILGVQRVEPQYVSSYGIVDSEQIGDRIHRVNNLIEKPAQDKAPSNIAIIGRYIITPRIFDMLEQTTSGYGGEIQLTDALKQLANEQSMYAYEFEGKRYDIGDKLGFLQASIELALGRPELSEDLMSFIKGLI